MDYGGLLMMKPDYKAMTRKQLKEHLATHRHDEEAWSAFFQKISELDPTLGYSPDLSDQEMENIFKEKIQNEPKKT